MAETAPGIGDITSVKQPEQFSAPPRPESQSRRSTTGRRTPAVGIGATIAKVGLAASMALVGGHALIDQGGPVVVSAAGETPTRTPTPTPDALKTTTANQIATNTALAGQVVKERQTQTAKATDEAFLTGLQDTFNKTQADRAAGLPPTQTAAAQQTAQAETDQLRLGLAARAKTEANAAGTATRVAGATATSAVQKATTQAGVDQVTATAVAVSVANQAKKNDSNSYKGPTLKWILGILGVVATPFVVAGKLRKPWTGWVKKFIKG